MSKRVLLQNVLLTLEGALASIKVDCPISLLELIARELEGCELTVTEIEGKFDFAVAQAIKSGTEFNVANLQLARGFLIIALRYPSTLGLATN